MHPDEKRVRPCKIWGWRGYMAGGKEEQRYTIQIRGYLHGVYPATWLRFCRLLHVSESTLEFSRIYPLK